MVAGKKDLNEGSALFHLVRNIGSSVSISLTIALIIRSTSMNYSDLSAFISIFFESNSIMTLKGSALPISPKEMFLLSGEINRQSKMIGYINGFYLYAFVAFAIIPLIMLVRMKDILESRASK